MTENNSDTVVLMGNMSGTWEHFQPDSWSKGLVVGLCFARHYLVTYLNCNLFLEGLPMVFVSVYC